MPLVTATDILNQARESMQVRNRTHREALDQMRGTYVMTATNRYYSDAAAASFFIGSVVTGVQANPQLENLLLSLRKFFDGRMEGKEELSMLYEGAIHQALDDMDQDEIKQKLGLT